MQTENQTTGGNGLKYFECQCDLTSMEVLNLTVVTPIRSHDCDQ